MFDDFEQMLQDNIALEIMMHEIDWENLVYEDLTSTVDESPAVIDQAAFQKISNVDKATQTECDVDNEVIFVCEFKSEKLNEINGKKIHPFFLKKNFKLFLFVM